MSNVFWIVCALAAGFPPDEPAWEHQDSREFVSWANRYLSEIISFQDLLLLTLAYGARKISLQR